MALYASPIFEEALRPTFRIIKFATELHSMPRDYTGPQIGVVPWKLIMPYSKGD